MKNPSGKTSLFKTLKVGIIPTFAALNVLAGLIPVTPIIGIPGASFKLSWAVAPLTGLLLGPLAGGLSCFIASLIESLLGLKVWVFGPLSLISSTISAVQSGLITCKRWRVSAIIIAFLILVWVILPIGRESVAILVFHLAGLLLLVLLRGRVGEYLNLNDMKKVALGVAVASYCGNISRHLFGNILCVTILKLPSIVFISAMPFTLIEQLTFTIGATLIGTPLASLELSRRLRYR